MLERSCLSVEEMESAVLDDQLNFSGTDSDWLAHHLETCWECRRVADSIESRIAKELGFLRDGNDVSTPRLSVARPAESGKTAPVPVVLGNYRVGEKLGSGAMGVVYSVRSSAPHREYAAKVLRPEILLTDIGLARFEREIENASTLKHDNIVAIHYWDLNHSPPFLVMDKVDGQSLEQVIQSKMKLTDTEKISMIRQVALGLQHAHHHGVIHRDLKPANLLVDRLGGVKIADFGLSKATTIGVRDGVASKDLSSQRYFLGTPDYCSPEQADNPSEAVGKSDVYSLGCTFFELLTGAPPFANLETKFEKAVAHASAKIPSVKRGIGRNLQLSSSLSVKLDELIQRMTAKSVEDRISAGEVVRHIDELAKPSELIQEVPRTSVPRPTIVSKQNPGAALSRSRGWLDRGSMRIGFGICALLIGFLFCWFCADIVFKTTTVDGTLTVVVKSGDYRISLDGSDEQGENWVVTSDGLNDQISMKLKPGAHNVKVTRNGFSTYTDNFTITRGKETQLQVNFVPASKPIVDTESSKKKTEMASERTALGSRLDIADSDLAKNSATNRNSVDPQEWVNSYGGRLLSHSIEFQKTDLSGVATFDPVMNLESVVDAIFVNVKLPAHGLVNFPKSVRALHVRNCITNERIIEDVAKLGLRYLNLEGSEIPGDALKHFLGENGQWLETLSLTNADCDPENLKFVARLNSLRTLALQSFDANEEDFLHLGALSDLTNLDVNSVSVGDAFLNEICKNMKKLQVLHLAKTQLTETGLADIALLKNLKVLSVNFCRFDTTSLGQLRTLRRLERLRLYRTHVDAADLEFLIELPRLNFLDLGGNKIDRRMLQLLGKLDNLQTLFLHDAELDGVTRERFAEELPQCKLHW